MFVSIVNEDYPLYPALHFKEKSVSMHAIIDKKFLAKCKICPTSCRYILHLAMLIYKYLFIGQYARLVFEMLIEHPMFYTYKVSNV